MAPFSGLGGFDKNCDRCFVALLSSDGALRQRVAEVVQGAGARFMVAGDRDSAYALLQNGQCGIRIIDYGSPEVMPLPTPGGDCPAVVRPGVRRPCPVLVEPLVGVECPVLRSGPQDGLLVVLGSWKPGTPVVEPLRAFLYPRSRVDEMLGELAMLRLTCAAAADSGMRILGETSAIELVREQIRSVARFRDVSVLILGETGTGKELVAHSIHRLSFGNGAPFIAINCAAIPEALFESELFGHEAGAYTGARGPRKGLLQAAAGGTILLDEIGETPASLQPKLLRALESRTFRRVGSNEDIPLQARVISATNRQPVLRGASLRPDLYYRLAGFTIAVPPLRARVADVELLARGFLRAFVERHSGGPRDFAPEALDLLRAHSWPGNVRELRAVVEYAAIVSRDDIVGPEDLVFSPAAEQRTLREEPRPPAASPQPAAVTPVAGTTMGLRDIERDLIAKAFAECSGNLSRAAKRLGIPRTTLRAKLRRHRIC